MLGVMKTSDALKKARLSGLDLVEISPTARPPVCRIMDHGKYLYDLNRKNKSSRKQQHSHAVKEIKFHSNVEEHDYQTKLSRIVEFVTKGHKVKVSLMFRGRENAHRDLGFKLIERVISDCGELASVDMSPKLIGRHIVSMIAPRAAKIPVKGRQEKAPKKAPKKAPAEGPEKAPAPPSAETPAKAPQEAAAPEAAPKEASAPVAADAPAATVEAAAEST